MIEDDSELKPVLITESQPSAKHKFEASCQSLTDALLKLYTLTNALKRAASATEEDSPSGMFPMRC